MCMLVSARSITLQHSRLRRAVVVAAKHRSSQLFSGEQRESLVYEAASVNTVHLTDCRTMYSLAKEIGDTIEVHYVKCWIER